MVKNVLLILMVGLLGLTACGGIPPQVQFTPTAPAATPADTPTILWFPPTNTPTIFPTPTAITTPEQPPGLGDLLFTDSFNLPNLWNTANSGSASAAVNLGRLVLSITGPGPVTIISLRSEPALGDFYAEATATLSLCLGNDEYGMIFHAAPGDSYYRFTVNCSGQVRLERSLSGSLVPMMDWLSTGDAPPGAPAEVRLGVWVVNNEMRFFLNDNYQFTSSDPTLRSGTIGFFIYASGVSPVAVAFSNLLVYSVAYTSPTPTPIPSNTPRPTQTP